MNEAWSKGDDARRAQAAEWLVRLQADDATDVVACDFDAWLSAHPANAAAYDATLAVTLELQTAADRIVDGLDAAPRRRRPASRGWLLAGGVAAAATLALAVMPYGMLAPAVAQTYATAKGEHRTVKLADGSTIELNAGSSLSVTLGRHERHVVMPQGEAVFDVAADKARPFLIDVGDRTVRVVGTRFDVRHRGAELSVAVERGVVEVRPGHDLAGRVWRLHPGQKLDTIEGVTAVALTTVDPQQVESWRVGRLIYRDQPLGDVVADLNQQFAKPITLEDPALAAVRVSGVLVLDDQAAVIRRLALLAPIKALPLGQGVLLRSDPAVKP
ncbi:FecR family protein [Phenylobacterium sp.]|uniref:FecR family protein n=1 Tax=Phenylobacterium sp. TaxID=1871053 RepID=UPI002E34CD1C|nr:FecR domain-containing protein [Phenylobacterium sp.]HEX3366634.1 FecR domain-containing protein [Phenylobacterium sp.]